MSGAFTSDLSGPEQEAEEFLYIVTHDLKAFARAMRTIPDWIAEDLAALGQTLPPGADENIAMLRDYAKRMNLTLDALTELSRVGRLSDRPVPHDLQALVRAECAAVPASPVLDYRIACEDVSVFGPANDLHRLFKAVLGNAAQHHDRDNGVLSVEAKVKGARVHVTVSDDGPGIPADQHQTVFKPLTTLRPKSETGHSGVGLTIARKVVQLLGGEIRIMPAKGARGCRLRFDLPAADVSP